MSSSEALRQQLQSVQTLYEAVKALHQQYEERTTLPQAEEEWRALFSEEDRALNERRAVQEQLLRQKRLRMRARARPWRPVMKTGDDDGETPPERSTSRVPHPPAGLPSAARRRVMKLVGRYRYAWRLDPTVISRINRIAADHDRPLGEALLLLDWSIYANPAQDETTQVQHSARLKEWGEALEEYRSRLSAELGTLELKYRSFMWIWSRWQVRGRNEADRLEWDEFVATMRRAKQAELSGVEAQIDELRNRIESRGGGA